VVVANPRSGVTDPAKVDRKVLTALGTERALPFLSGDQKLSGKFGASGSCGLSRTARQKVEPKSTTQPAQQQSAPAPEPPEPPSEPDGKGHPGSDRGSRGGGVRD
jgi:hypothetical protein